MELFLYAKLNCSKKLFNLTEEFEIEMFFFYYTVYLC